MGRKGGTGSPGAGKGGSGSGGGSGGGSSGGGGGGGSSGGGGGGGSGGGGGGSSSQSATVSQTGSEIGGVTITGTSEGATFSFLQLLLGRHLYLLRQNKQMCQMLQSQADQAQERMRAVMALHQKLVKNSAVLLKVFSAEFPRRLDLVLVLQQVGPKIQTQEA